MPHTLRIHCLTILEREYRMKFIKLKLVGQPVKAGQPKPPPAYYWTRPKKILGVGTIMAPSGVMDNNNKPVFTQKAGLQMGSTTIPIDMKPEELVALLEKLEGV